MILSKNQNAQDAYVTVIQIQKYFVEKLNVVSKEYGNDKNFEEVTWLRDEGEHGGGTRFEARDDKVFNRGSVNVSQVQYDNIENKKLGSASAISTIIHPHNPHVPSMHMHISWTQMKNGNGYWRLMADLNPSLLGESNEDKQRFDEMLKESSGKYYDEGIRQGDKYFYIPALNRHRGVSHFYLEGFNSDDFNADKDFAYSFGTAVIDRYIEIITNKLRSYGHTYTKEERAEQLEYHTLYLFQVLTLDRGTTSGLLIHNQNDVGIMGSIPSHVNRDLLKSWKDNVKSPQDELVGDLVDSLSNTTIALVDVDTKLNLAQAVRDHYTKYPNALAMQASGNTTPPTVDNHK